MRKLTTVAALTLLTKLYDGLKAAKYNQHDTNIFMVRLLYCLFADNAGIWRKKLFRDYIKYRTAMNGTDLDAKLSKLFNVLNTEPKARYDKLDESLSAFPYVNGALYKEQLPIPSFDKEARTLLLDCCDHDWSKVSPAIFGSIFQSIMNSKERRASGAHYTSEENILKVINPLFMNDLRAEFAKIGNDQLKLDTFHTKIASLKFLDPACGCGNFLVVAYRELRNLELEVLKMRKSIFNVHKSVKEMVRVNIDQFYGIEIDEWPTRIANVSMWIQDHKSNVEVSKVFGETRPSIPLKECAHIKNANALRTEWPNVDYIFGNPPFVGKCNRSKDQKTDYDSVMRNIPKSGGSDFVLAWFKLAADTGKPSALVSTNSITQGVQAAVLVKSLGAMSINFAYRSFPWVSEARGKAAVYCVIVGFGPSKKDKRLFTTLEDGSVTEQKTRAISPNLIAGTTLYVEERNEPLSATLKMRVGSNPVDGGHLDLNAEEKKSLIAEGVPPSWIRPYLGSAEMINNKERYILWIKDVEPSKIRSFKTIVNRLKQVKSFRSNAKSISNKNISPRRFRTYGVHDVHSLFVPLVSSENRDYIPMAFISKDVIPSVQAAVLPNATTYHFGILTSQMHMAWMRAVCGRFIESYSYSNTLVYNNFIWPKATKEDEKLISKLAQGVLDTRAKYPDSTLADLYDPNTMPADLLKAHKALDKAVDELYKDGGFESDDKRVAHLFKLYAKAIKKVDLFR